MSGKETHRLKRFYVRCSEAEFEAYKADADKAGLTMSDYVRVAMTFYRGVQEGLRMAANDKDA